MNRWRRVIPRYRTPVIVRRAHDGAAAATGTNRIHEPRARYLRAFPHTEAGRVPTPAGRGPETQTAEPDDLDGWKAWWPAAPDVFRGRYQIPDPPKIARPVLPTASNPVLWEAGVQVVDGGSNVWTLRISAVYALVDWIPLTGAEKLTGLQKLSINSARLKIRPTIIDIARIDSIEWDIVKVDTGDIWKLEAIVPSFRRGEFAEMLVERVR